MAITKTVIINKACTQVGARTVTSIDDGSDTANVLSAIYEPCLKSVLNECKWNFATKRAALATNSTVTLDFYDVGQGALYDRPTDVVRIFNSDPPYAKWKEEGDYIISDSSALSLRYVYYIEDTTKFPIYFVEALVDKLSADIAYAIVNSASLADSFLRKYEKISLPKAISSNSQTGEQQTMVDDAWTIAKYNDTQSDA
jgi:hypothetical protein